jgi:hypothetical protein
VQEFIKKNMLIISFGSIGLIFMIVALYHEINPIEASVVSNRIRGTNLHLFLLVSCYPAMFIALFLSFFSPYFYYIFACLFQVLIYGSFGKILSIVISKVLSMGRK